MSAAPSVRPGNPPSGDYLALVKRSPLVSISNAGQYDSAIDLLDELHAAASLSEGQQDYLDALCDLVHVYEAAHEQLPPPTDAGLLEFLMEQRGVSQAEGHRGTQIAKSTISGILNGSRPLAREHIGPLSEFFGVGRDVLTANF